MRRRVFVTALGLAATAFALTVSAQKTTPVHGGTGGSPHIRTEWTIGGANISIEYGRPYLKSRPEAQMMPPGQEWRTGADEATTLKTDKPLKFGALALPAGTYTIYTVPGEKTWQLVISKKTGQWGIPYPGTGEDFGRAPMAVGKAKAPAEQLTISIDSSASGGTLRIEWGTTSATIPLTVGS
jgi:hypothetical protein